ncbi:PilN family type IVB pilus formation outer membrane protein [Castellaniella sp. UC4442_H9]
MKRLSTTVAVALAISGCAVQRTNDTIRAADKTAESITSKVDDARAARSPSVIVEDKPWVSLKPIAVVPHDTRLPESMRCKLTFAPVQPVSLLEFSQIVTQLCGVPVRVTPDALAFLSGARPASGRTGGGLPPVPPLPSRTPASAKILPTVGPTPIVPQLMANAAEYGQSGMISGIKWAGKPIAGLLDVVTARLGLSWRYEHGAISVFHVDTRTYRLTVVPSTTTMKSVVTTGSTLSQASNGSSTGSNASGGAADLSGSSSQSTEVAITTNIVKDIEATVKSMLTADGQMHMSYSTGTVAVTDTPEVLDRIGTYLAAENANLQRMVRINIDLLVVTLNSSDRFGINWNLVYKQLAGKYGGSIVGGMSPGDGSVVSSLGVLDTANSEFSGTKLIFDALSTQGTVSVLTTPTINTLNLQPAPLQIAQQQYFVKGSTSTATANVGLQSSMELGAITTGFNVSVLPNIIDSNDLQLDISGSISPPATLRQIDKNGAYAEAPDTSSRTFQQRVQLRSGQTVVLSGYEQTNDQGNKAGVGDPGFMALGGSASRTSKREVLVILVTPVIQDPSPTTSARSAT